eukprot:TRINITY_DN103714_c0_g1_i1.p1 TRINITY_DN103714_c0_g1~~TRINITY_DN103714_c0_g1_i1.p1  ORF type:complete len:401 (+),score=91.83 TRINITY_DN103714_c0_g1_i1:51-1253(+)
MQAGPGKIFWIDAGSKKIRCANTDGSCIEDVLDDLTSPAGLAVDAAQSLLYWSDLGDKKIWKANIDGTGRQTVVSGLSPSSGTSLGLDETRVLWPDLAQKRIMCARKDGSDSAPKALVTDLVKPNAVAVDAFGGKIYWGDFGTRKIHRCESQGFGSPEVVVPYGKNSNSLVVDSIRGKIFWSNFGTHAIYRCNLDGQAMEPIIMDLENPSALALAPKAGRLYWIERNSGKIRRAAVDGSHVEDVLSDLGDPWSLALGPEPTKTSRGAAELGAICDGYPASDEVVEQVSHAVEEVCTVPITKYSWTDEDSAVKVYISESANPAALAAAASGSMDTDFQEKSFRLTVEGKDGARFELRIRGLLHEILPEKCKARVSIGKRITVSLAKKDGKQTWKALSNRNW